MDYHVFINSLLEYYQLYERGLKKKANKYIQDYVISLSQWDKDKLRDVLFHFTKELCDEPVSYTHLDVYKRQVLQRLMNSFIILLEHIC